MVQLLLTTINEGICASIISIPLWFNYYTDLIEACKKVMTFQFHYGSIITKSLFVDFMPFVNFNSTMVQLLLYLLQNTVLS